MIKPFNYAKPKTSGTEFRVGEGMTPAQTETAYKSFEPDYAMESQMADSFSGLLKNTIKALPSAYIDLGNKTINAFSMREEPVELRSMFEDKSYSTKLPPAVTQLGGIGIMIAEMIPKGLATVYGQFLAPKQERKTGSVDLGFNAKRLGFEEETFSTAEKRILDCQNAGGSALQCGLKVGSEMSADILFPAQIATSVFKTVQRSLLKSGVEKTINAWDLLNKPTIENIEKNKVAELTKVFESVKDLPLKDREVIISKLNNELNNAVKILKDKGIPTTIDQIKYKVAQVAEVAGRESPIRIITRDAEGKLSFDKNFGDDVKNLVTNPDISLKTTGNELNIPFKQLPGTRERPGQAPAFGMSTKEVENVGKTSLSTEIKTEGIQKPNLELKRDVTVTTLSGEKVTIPKGEALSAYEKGGKALLKDGREYIVSKSQYENIKNNSLKSEAKEFAPELSGTEESIRGGAKLKINIKELPEGSTITKTRTGLYEVKVGNSSFMGEIKQDAINSALEQVNLDAKWKNSKEMNNTKYSNYQLPNGKNYKEVLIKAQDKWDLRENGSEKVVKTFDTYKEAQDAMMGDSKKYHIIPTNGKFKSSHWEEPNVISHLRLNERTYKGKKVTFMEELQSDWARSERDMVAKAKSGANFIPQKGHPLLKNWQELSIKRALKEAVDNNSEYFAWINGEQTSARYNLATHLEDVKWGKSARDGEKIEVFLKPKEAEKIHIGLDNKGTITYSSKGDWKGKKLDEVLGKGLADKIMEKPTGNLSGEGLSFGGEWANNLYDKQVKNIVEDLTGGKVEVLDMGIKGEKTVEFYTNAQKSRANAIPIKQSELKVGVEVFKNDLAGGKDGSFVITEILEDGKFKAVPKTFYESVKVGKAQGAKNPALNTAKETFDISTKKSAGQQGIKITPEIRAIVKGEEIPIKKPSGGSPVQAFGAAGGLEQDDEGNLRFNPIKAAFGVAAFSLIQKSGAIKTIEELIAEGQARVVSRAGKNVFQVQKLGKWIQVKTPEEAIKVSEIYAKSNAVENAVERAKAGEDFGPRIQNTLEFNPTKAAMDVPGFTAIKEGGELTIKNLDDLAKKMANKYASRATLEQIRVEIGIAEGIVSEMPGRKLVKFMSKSTGQFEDFRNPDLAKTPSEAKLIKERNRKVMKESESAFEGTQYADEFDNPDSIREAIDKYTTLRDKLKVLKQNMVTVKEELSKVRMGEYLMQLAKGERRAAYKSLGETFNLTDVELADIRGRKDIMALTEPEFNDFMKQAEAKAAELEELSDAKIQLESTIKDKDLMKWENLQQALKLPKVDEMNVNQIRAFENTLSQYKTYDEFLTVRQLETIDKTELIGKKTVREVIEHLAKTTGVTVNEAAQAKPHPWMYDTQLQRADPFNKLLVDKYNSSFLKAEERSISLVKENDRLTNAARKSKSRTLGQKLVPTDPKIKEWLEAEPEMREIISDSMTVQELKLARFQDNYFKEVYDWMTKRELERKFSSRYEDKYYPHIRRGFLEAWKDEGFIKALGEAKVQYSQDEAVMTILNEKTGDILPYQKWVKFEQFRTGNLVPSQNSALTFKTYVHAVEKARQFDEFIPEMMIYANSLSPRLTTERGVEINDTLQTFFKKWINSKKGRVDKLAVTPGGKADWALRTGTALLRIRDLGFNLATQVASAVGEQAGNVVMLRTKYPLGVLRLATAQGRAITKQYENFVGKSIYEKFFEASTDVGDKLMTGIMGIFGEASRKANQTFLLSMMTKEEFNSGTISIKRLAELRNKMGRYRVVEGAESIIGKTAEMAVVKQHKKWAIPIIVTTADNFRILAQKVKKDGVHALKSEEASELLTATLLTAVIGLGSYGYYQNLSEKGSKRNVVEDLAFKLTRESLSLITALDPRFIVGFTTPRAVSFLKDMSDSLMSIVKLEEYQTGDKEGELKGIQALKRTITPVALTQFLSEEESKAQKELEKLKALPKEEANKIMKDYKKNDPSLFRKIKTLKEDEDLGITDDDKKIRALGVENGARAEFIYKEAMKLDTKEEKNAYLKELAKKKIISFDKYVEGDNEGKYKNETLRQIIELMRQDTK